MARASDGRCNRTSAPQAFGLGALEDDDDEEVYHRDSMSRYDTELGGEEPGDGLYGWTAPQQYTKSRGEIGEILVDLPPSWSQSPGLNTP